MEHESRDLQREMAKATAQLDDIEATTPEFGYFKGIVEAQQKKLRHAHRVQLALFVIVALAMVSAIILLAGRFQLLFLLLQGVFVASTAIGLVAFLVRPKRRHQGA